MLARRHRGRQPQQLTKIVATVAQHDYLRGGVNTAYSRAATTRIDDKEIVGETFPSLIRLGKVFSYNFGRRIRARIITLAPKQIRTLQGLGRLLFGGGCPLGGTSPSLPWSSPPVGLLWQQPVPPYGAHVAVVHPAGGEKQEKHGRALARNCS